MARTITGTNQADLIDASILPLDDFIILAAGGNDTVIGGSGNDQLSGQAGSDTLNGGAGNDLLDGGTGGDTMAGGTGDDIYVVDSGADIVTELPGEGTDTVQSSITYTLTANVENLILTGTGNINGTGNTSDNSITGNSGNNIIDGGVGADTMAGGAGNDTYVVDNVGDIVIEGSAAGTDTVQSSIDYTLTPNVENLTLTGTGNLNGTGNDLNNKITGNAGISSTAAPAPTRWSAAPATTPISSTTLATS
jgi:Ca2+-binding RTX toxin-like protein